MVEQILVKGEKERERERRKKKEGGVHQNSQMYVVQCSWISIWLWRFKKKEIQSKN